MNDIIERALKELNEEGLLNGNSITEKGKIEAEQILKSEPKLQNGMFKFFWKKLEPLFYELEPREFCLKVLELEGLLKKAGVDLEGELRNL